MKWMQPWWGKIIFETVEYIFFYFRRETKEWERVERERRMQKQLKYERNRNKMKNKMRQKCITRPKKANGIKNRKYIAFLPWIPNWQFCSIFKVRCERIWESFPLTSLPGCFGNRVKKGWGKSRGATKYLSVQKTAVFPDSHCAQRLLWYTHSSQL